jgi:hypothetical protein
MSNVFIKIFSKILHFLMSVTQDGRKFLFSSDDIKIIEKSWETLDLGFEANIILCGSLNDKLCRNTLKMQEIN